MGSRKLSFTLSRLNNLTCELGKSQTIYWDTRFPGLGIRITAAGHKAFIFQSWLNNSSMRITLGDIKTWTISAAQTEARRLKVLTDQGIDPRDERADQKAKAVAERLQNIPAMVIWNDYVATRKHHWSQRHLADHENMVRDGGELITRGSKPGQSNIQQPGILRKILSLPLNQITREIVLIWLKKEVVVRPTRTRLTLSLLKTFLTWASDQPQYRAFIDTTACERLARELPPKRAKEDCLQKEQLKHWFQAVQGITNPIIRAYLQCLLSTGARRNELATLRWTDVDLQWNTMVIRDKVEGNRKIPLTPYVSMLIKHLPRVNDYVFSSLTASSGYITEPRKAHNQALHTAGLPALTLHGLRRSFRTLAEWVECPAGISAQIMGHKPSAIAEKHYRKRLTDLLRQWHTKIEDFILQEAGVIPVKCIR